MQAQTQQPNVQPGYPYQKRPGLSMRAATQMLPQNVKILPHVTGQEAVHNQVARRKEMMARQNAMMRPPAKQFQWYQPAYSQIMGQELKAYPSNFMQTYGVGRYPDSYYYGLTPKDVLQSLAASNKASMSKLSRPTAAPMVMQAQEIAQSQHFLKQFAAVFYGGQIPSNQFILELIQRGNGSIRQTLGSRQAFSQDTRQLLEASSNLLQTVHQILVQKNPDQVFQSFVHHALLSAMIVKQYHARLRATESAFVQPDQHNADFQVNLIGMLMQSGNLYDSLTDLVDLLRHMVGPVGSQQPTYQQPATSLRPMTPDSGIGVMQDADQDVEYSTPVMAQPVHQTDQGPQLFKRPAYVEETPQMKPHVRFQQQPTQTVPPQQQFVPMQQVPYQTVPGQVNYVGALQQPIEAEIATRILDDMRMFMRSLSQDPNARQLFTALAGMLSELGQISGISSSNERTIPLLHHDANRYAMLNDLKTIVERFASDHSLDDLILLIDQFQALYMQSWPLRSYLDDVTAFVTRCMTHERYLDGPDYLPRGIELLKKGRMLLSSPPFSELTNEVLNEVFTLIQDVKEDPLTRQLAQAVEQLVVAAAVDDQGNYTLKTSILTDARDVLLPMLLQSMRYLPLPRIEVSDNNIDFALDNIVLNLDNVLPNLVEFSMSNSVQVSPRTDLPDAYYMNVAELNVLQIQCDLKNVEFAFSKKSFPQMQDMGLADLYLGGNGLSIYTRTAIDTNLWYTTLVPVLIKCDIDALKIRMHDSNHDTMYKLLGKNLVRMLKTTICRAVEEAIFKVITQLDGVVTQIANRKQTQYVNHRVNLW